MKKIHLLALLFLVFLIGCKKDKTPPNVILIITDDQGYGDLSFNGNPNIITPALDNFAAESVRFNNFYVSPVCAPTRSSLMTGRYSLRTGVRDTYNGGAIMASSEVTIAEMLKQANFTTGIFGKWHLGDNYPSRPSDQGFDESLIHLAGGMGQVGDFTNYFKKDTSYFDPILWHNNEQKPYKGYCSDIFTENAIEFIEKNKNNPFFCYLSFNAPHNPLQVPDEYYQAYKTLDPTDGIDPELIPNEKISEKTKDNTRKVYAMVTNIDDNLKKLFNKVDELGIKDNTIVIFMTDNGPQHVRYIAGMKGRKSSVYNGGIRVPFFLRFPAMFSGNQEVNQFTAHIDLLPTLSKLCNVEMPRDRKIDGRSFIPSINSEKLPERSFFSYWTRKYPELYNNIALQRGQFKLIGKTDYNSPIENFELYDTYNDPFEKNNLVTQKKSIALSLKKEMHQTFLELVNSENLKNPPRIMLGSDFENPVYLNRNDAGGQRAVWNQEQAYSFWKVDINKEGLYDLKFKFLKPLPANGNMYLEIGQSIQQKFNSKDNLDLIEMKSVYLPKGFNDFTPFYMFQKGNYFPLYVEVTAK
ncbi:MAG: arylsulfatase [Bacteroidota bacterium]|nr:arylsulfatase [Bacteroidota bacterium]